MYFCVLCIVYSCCLFFRFSPTHIFLSVANGRTQPCPRSCEQKRNFAKVGQRKDNGKGLDNLTQHADMRCICTPPKEGRARGESKRDRPEMTEKREKGRWAQHEVHMVCMCLCLTPLLCTISLDLDSDFQPSPPARQLQQKQQRKTARRGPTHQTHRES